MKAQYIEVRHKFKHRNGNYNRLLYIGFFRKIILESISEVNIVSKYQIFVNLSQFILIYVFLIV